MRSAGWRTVALVLAIVLCCCSPCVGVVTFKIFNCCTSDYLTRPGCSAVVSPNSNDDCTAVNDLVLAFSTVLNPPIADDNAVDICATSQNTNYSAAIYSLVRCNSQGQVSAVLEGTGNSGGLPATISSLSSLTYLSPAALSGTLPDSLSQLTSLQVIRFGGQYYYVSKLTGSLPSLSGMTDLRFLDLSGNTLSGTLPPNMFDGMNRLEYVDFHGGNQFTGSLPPSLLNLPALKVVDVSGNSFTGSLSETNAPTLQYLNLRDNSFSGTLPQAFLNGITQVSGLYLGNNQLSGALPDFSVLTALTSVSPSYSSPWITLDQTGLTGVAASAGVVVYYALAFLKMGGTDQISMPLLDLSRNNFVGAVNMTRLPYGGEKSSTFQGTDLSNNQLSASGYVPGSALYNVAAMHPQVGFGVTGTTVTVSTLADLQRALSLRFSNSTGFFFSIPNRAITTIVLTSNLTLTSALIVGANPFADVYGAVSLQASYPSAIPFGTITQHGLGYPMQTTFVGLNSVNSPFTTAVGCTEPTTEILTTSPGSYQMQFPCLISPSRSVTIVGACDPGPCVLEGQNLHRHFEVYNSGLRLQNLKLTNGQGPTDYSGNYLQYQVGGAYAISTLWGGGAIFADGGSVVELNNCILSGNVAHPPGGGAVASLAMHPLSVTVTSSSLAYNLAYGSSGGAIYTRGGVVLSNVSFTSNIADYGGAVFAVLGVNATGCSFSQNNALLTGGAVVVPAVSATDTGLFSYYRPALIDRWLPPRVQPDSAFSATSFTANSCTGAGSGQGGAVYAPTGTSVGLTQCTFAGNSASLAGGALYGDGVNDVGSLFSANTISSTGLPDACSAAGGGALAVVGTRGLSLSGTVFDSNQGKTQGGAIFAMYQTPYSDKFEVANAVYVTAVLSNVVLTNNFVSTGGGGAMVLGNLAATLSNVTCSNNSANNGTGIGGCLNALQLGGLTIGGGSVFSANGAASGGAIGISCGIACAGTAYACGGGGGGGFKPSVVVKISQTTFSLNGATSQGGALYVRGGGIVLNQTSFVGNDVQGLVAQGGGLFMAEYWANGAAVALAPAGLSLINTSFVRNMALVTSSYSSPTELFSQVSAPGSGGALMFSSTVSAPPLIASAGTTWVGNYANTAGAAYINGRTVLTLTNATFSSNAATGTAGALLLTMPASLQSTMAATFSSVTFSSNSAQLGGAVALYSSVAVAADSCTWTNNSAINGGAFSLSVAEGACSLALTAASTIGNTAGLSGGLYYTDATTPASAPSVSCTGLCTGNAALNGPDSLAAVPVRHVCSLNGSVTSIKSGQAVPAFNVSLYDGLGSLVASAPDVVVTITSTSSGMAGTTAAPYHGGAATFLSLTFTELPGTTITLTWHISSTSLDSVNGQTGSAQVVVAACDALEILDPSLLKCVCQAGTVLTPTTTLAPVTYACQLCPAGQYAPTYGSSSCLINTPGYYSSESRDQQLPCPVGTFLDGTSLACAACQPGSYTSVEGQTSCQVNPAGTVSSPQTTQSCSLALAGVSASALGTAQQVTLASSIATTLNVSTSAVAVLAVADVAARRRLSATKAQVNFTVVATGTAKTAAVSSSLNATATFTQALAASLSQSGDPVLRALTPAAITASAPRATTVYLQAEPCPSGTYLNGINQTCDACAVGTVAPAPSSITCTACAARTAWLDATRDCQPCPDNAVTSPNSPTQCACSVGYYDTLFGTSVASPVCAPCPLGGVCETGFLAADVDWWRASTVSDVMYKCKVGNCLSESVAGPLTVGSAVGPPLRDDTSPTNCVDGNTGPLCALCLDGYALQSGQCLPCPPGDAFAAWSAGAKAALVLLCIVAGLFVIALAFFQPLSPSLEAKWAAVTGAVSSTFDKAMALPQRAVHRCVPGLSAKAQRDSTSSEPQSPKAAATPSSRLKEAHAVADAEPEVPLHADSTEAASSVRVADAIHTLMQDGHKGGAFDAAAPSVRLSAGGAVDAAASPEGEHPQQSVRRSTTGAEAAAAVRAARHSAGAAMVASMEGEAMAMASAASRRLVELISDELTGDGNVDGDDSDDSEVNYDGATGEALELLEKAQRLIEKAQKYAKIVINFYQIVSTFIRSLDIPWPHIFVTTMGKVSIINLNLVRLPKAACLSPQPSYYAEFNGYTLGLLCALLFIAAFWAFGLFLLAPLTLRGLSEADIKERRGNFSSTCLQRTLMLLFLVYPGVSVAIFGMFSCTEVGDSSWLDQDFRIACYDRTWWRYCGGAIVWLLLVPAGVPLFFTALLRRFRVPDMAALVEDNAWLREAAEHTWRLGMPQPAVNVQTLCCDTIDDTHLAMLCAVLLHGADADAAADILAGRTPKAGAAVPDEEADKAAPAQKRSLIMRGLVRVVALRDRIAAALRPQVALELATPAASERAAQLARLMLWCRHSGVLSIGPMAWTDELGLPEAEPDASTLHAPHRTGLRSHEVPELLKRASIECGFLFSIYSTRCWYWESVELLRKLVLTSILALISPGSAGQVVVGALVALFALLANIKLKPFAERSLNFVNQVAQLNLFLFLFVALLLKVNLDGDSSASFYTGIVIFMSVLPVVLPVGLHLYIRLGGFSGEDAVDAKDAAEEGNFDAGD